ncbi:hypothetical protein B0T22DRAFT_463706 [Podospora appendiculata]|uniref:rRNA adenine N(6)-methyltransferase n=1 Tax=Podospora appendiculata TaxID=314037 RepID=A0AAE0XDR8_9PEZI|nr:hypothetical protein B0T22DRAFT_463706 [Podospora appendiculata]
MLSVRSNARALLSPLAGASVAIARRCQCQCQAPFQSQFQFQQRQQQQRRRNTTTTATESASAPPEPDTLVKKVRKRRVVKTKPVDPLAAASEESDLASKLHSPELEICREPKKANPRASLLVAETDLAKKLHDTRLWRSGRVRKQGVIGDWHRVNVVSEGLCDDIIEYIKPSLLRHKGCDLIDIFPGPGLFSSKMHDLLEPRTHILMEPDEDIYKPMLEPLLQRPNTVYTTRSGIIWSDLNEIMTPAFLPHQIERSNFAGGRGGEPKRNDTLLVMANLATYPKRKYRSFDSVTQLVLFQFMSAIKTSALFHKYGLVRLLLWVAEPEEVGLVPRSVQRRRRMAVEAELSTDWLYEVAGPDSKDHWFQRDKSIENEGGHRVVARMRSNGYVTPPGRETRLLTKVLSQLEEGKTILAGEQQPEFDRKYLPALIEHEKLEADGKIVLKSPEYFRLIYLRYKVQWNDKRSGSAFELMKEAEQIAKDLVAATDDASRTAVAAREAAWNRKIEVLNANLRKEYFLHRDNLHIFHQSPQVLSWDRRPCEPLRVEPTEFYPNVPSFLLDIQPKAMFPLLRETGIGSSHAAESFEMILRSMLATSVLPVSKAFERLWTGAAEGVLPYCPSLRDPAQGGTPLGGFGEISCRSVNEKQLTEIITAWEKWPFKPSFNELVGKVNEGPAYREEDERGAATERVLSAF